MDFKSAIQFISEEHEALLQKQRQFEHMKTAVPIADAPACIRTARSEQGITLETLAKISGVSVPTLSRLDKGNQSISLDIYIKVASALGLKLWIN